MKKIIVNVPEDLYKALHARKAEIGTPVSEIIRRSLAVTLYGERPDFFVERRTNQPVLIPQRG